MIRVMINGFTWDYDPQTKQLHDTQDPAQFTTLDHMTRDERRQLRTQLQLDSLRQYYAEKFGQL